MDNTVNNLPSSKPNLYEKGTSFMWTDEHIAKQLLKVHLNPDIDLASRKKNTIERTAKWILETCGKEKMNILDLGCGPGLYTEIFAENGHNVTGVDISKNSIEYARKSSRQKNLAINYINGSYLDLTLEEDKYDLIVLIFTDLGVLLPGERNMLLEKVYKSLKTGGKFIFDLLRDNEICEKLTPKNEESSEGGFWSPRPYKSIAESFLYEKEKVILFQHTIIIQDSSVEIYRFWTHFFNEVDVIKMLEFQSFADVDHPKNVFPDSDMWSGDNVIFTVATK